MLDIVSNTMGTDFNPELGLAGETVQRCLEVLCIVCGNQGKEKYQDLEALEDRLDKLRLWADGFGVSGGALDKALESSTELKSAVYVALYDLISSLRICLTHVS